MKLSKGWALETWLPVAGYDGYEVSDCGRVRSWRRQGPSTNLASKPHLLQPATHPDGYFTVSLHQGGVQKTQLVHVLVARAFIGERPEGFQVCHIDGNPANNWSGNLRYDSAIGNAGDRIEHGRNAAGEKHGMAKLKADEVAAIRRGFKGGASKSALSRQFCISRYQVRRIVNGESWKVSS